MTLLAMAALILSACQKPSASDVQAERLAEVTSIANQVLAASFEFFDTEVSRDFTESITEASGGVADLGVNPSAEEAAFLVAGKQAIVEGLGSEIALPDLDSSELTRVFLSAYMAWKAGDESTQLAPKTMPQVLALEESSHYQVDLPAFSFVIGERMTWRVEFDSENRVRGLDLVGFEPVASE